MMLTLLVCVASYVIGSIPTGYLVARGVRKIDIRKHGSGNMGATNVFRVVGKAWGVGVLALDILKGFLPVIIFSPLLRFDAPDGHFLLLKILLGFMTVAGHNWTIFLGFKGGKGVATSCGAFLAVAPQAVLSAVVIWIVVVALTRYISLGSLLAAGSCPLWMWVYYREEATFGILFFVAWIIFVLIAVRHRTNIQRLLNGAESKIFSPKNKTS